MIFVAQGVRWGDALSDRRPAIGKADARPLIERQIGWLARNWPGFLLTAMAFGQIWSTLQPCATVLASNLSMVVPSRSSSPPRGWKSGHGGRRAYMSSRTIMAGCIGVMARK